MSDANDTPATASIDDHPFEPKGEWWSTCCVCGLAEAAHAVRGCLSCGRPLRHDEHGLCGPCAWEERQP